MGKESDQGWIKLFRKLKQNKVVWRNSVNCHFWIYCLLTACHEPQEVIINGKTIKLKPGQFIFGRAAAATELGLSEATAYRTIKRLEKNKMLNCKSTASYTVVTIPNWAKYQGLSKKGEQDSDRKVNRNPTEIRQESVHIQEYIEEAVLSAPLEGGAQAPKLPGARVDDIDWDEIERQGGEGHV